MDDGTEIKRNNRNTKFLKIYKEKGIVESHDRLLSERTRHIQEKTCFVLISDILKSQLEQSRLLTVEHCFKVKN